MCSMIFVESADSTSISVAEEPLKKESKDHRRISRVFGGRIGVAKAALAFFFFGGSLGEEFGASPTREQGHLLVWQPRGMS